MKRDAALALIAASLTASSAWAQAFQPSRPVELVVHGAQGGGSDVFAREVVEMAKKEGLHIQRDLAKLTRSLGGIKELERRPDALFVIDVGYQKGAVAEAKKLGIPVIGVVDTNHSPEGIAYVIPGNDDSSRAIRLYARGIADAILEGRNQAVQEIVGATSDEFVEVEESGARAE